jgi:hypothetical protein
MEIFLATTKRVVNIGIMFVISSWLTKSCYEINVDKRYVIAITFNDGA